LPLKGQDKTDYMREYMKRRRADEVKKAREGAKNFFNYAVQPPEPFDELLFKLLKMTQSDNPQEREATVHKVYRRMKQLKITWDDLQITLR